MARRTWWKVGALLAAMMMFLTMLPATALAAENDRPYSLYVGNTDVAKTEYSDNAAYWTSSDGGTNWTSQLDEPTADSYIHYDGNGTLTLHNVNISRSNENGIYAEAMSGSAVSLTIKLEGTNTVSGWSGIFVHTVYGAASLSISGTGSLTAEGTGGGSFSGIQVQSNDGKAELTINNVDVTATNNVAQGIILRSGGSSTASLTVNGGELTASGSDAGIKYVFGSSGTGDGTPTVTVSDNAIVRANGGISDDSSTDIQIGADSNESNGGIVFDGKNGTVYGNVTLQENLEIGEGESLTLGDGASLNTDGKLTVDGGTLTGDVTGTVNYKVTGVSLDKTSLELTEGETARLTATVEPSNATNKGVTWESSNTSVATVDANGLVTAVGTGATNITVTTDDGGKTATCMVTVTAKTYGLSASPASLDFGSVYTGYAQPAAQIVTVTNTGNQSVTLAQPTSTSFVVSALSATELDPDESATFSVQPKSGLAAETYSEQLTIATNGGSASCTVTLSFSVRTPYVPPRPTGPDWGDVADDIADAGPGSTVKVDMDGKTVLPGEVLDELAGRDVTLALDMGDGLFWEVHGGDVPADAEYDDVDLGVALGGDDIPADVANLVTGESGSVQVSLEHDGPFGFELTLVAPLGEDAAGLVANLYRYDDEAGSLGYEASAQVDGEGVARLPFDHASSWLVALDSRSHALPFPDALEGEWYSEAVRWAWLGGVMTGYGDGSGLFGTSSALTRAEAAVVLWRLAGEPEGVSGLPADCDPSGFYAEAASWALDAGLFSGYSGDAFGPADTITREQLATVLWRAAGSPEVGGDLSSFSDAADVSDFADVAMRWAVSVGVLRGQGDGDALDPQGACSRAQLATMLYRLAAAE